MNHQSVSKTFLLGLMLALSSSCREPQTENDAKKSSKGLLIINNLSEDFTIVDNTDKENAQISKNVPMNLNDKTDSHSCKSANHILKHTSYFYITCSLSHEIQIFDAETLELKRIISTGDTSNPWHTAIDDTTGYTSLYQANKILVYDARPNLAPKEPRFKNYISLEGLSLLRDGTEETQARPAGLAIVGNKLYVALQNLKADFTAGGPGYLAIIDTKTQTLSKIIKTNGRNTVAVQSGIHPQNPHWLYIVSSGSYVAGNGYFGDAVIDIYDIEQDRIIRSLTMPGAPNKLVPSSNGTVYLTNAQEAQIFSFDNSTFRVHKPIDLTHSRCGDSKQTFSYISDLLVDENYLYATEFNSNCLMLINLKTQDLVQKIRTGDGPQVMLKL